MSSVLATDPAKYGSLMHPSIKLHRQWFIEMTRLLGIRVNYFYPINSKIDQSTQKLTVKKGVNWTLYAELTSNYAPPIPIHCIFDQHPDQQTMKKIGWMSELSDSSSIIHVAYDLPNLQYGCLFEIPSGLDNSFGRFFRLVKLTTGIMYPASVICEVVPEYWDKYIPDQNTHENNSNQNVLQDEELHQTWN